MGGSNQPSLVKIPDFPFHTLFVSCVDILLRLAKAVRMFTKNSTLYCYYILFLFYYTNHSIERCHFFCRKVLQENYQRKFSEAFRFTSILNDLNRIEFKAAPLLFCHKRICKNFKIPLKQNWCTSLFYLQKSFNDKKLFKRCCFPSFFLTF